MNNADIFFDKENGKVEISMSLASLQKLYETLTEMVKDAYCLNFTLKFVQFHLRKALTAIEEEQSNDAPAKQD